MEHCEGCGYEWDALADDDFAPRLRAAVGGFAVALRSGAVDVRPSPERWSTLEYAAHVRDVMLNVRDRLILAAIEDNPSPPRLYPDARVELGLYHDDQPEQLAAELSVAAELAIRSVAALARADALERQLFYGYPVPANRSLRWGASQMLHELEHHLGDVQP